MTSQTRVSDGLALPGWIRMTRRVSRTMAVVSAMVSGAIMLGIVADVGRRELVGRSIPGMIELIETFMVIVVFLGLAYAEATGVHVRMSLVTNALGPRMRKAVKTFGMVVCMVGSASVSRTSAFRAVQSTTLREVRPGLLRFPIWPARIIVAFGFGMLALEYACRVWEEIHAPTPMPREQGRSIRQKNNTTPLASAAGPNRVGGSAVATGTILIIVVVVFFVLLASEVPIGFCLALAGAVGIALDRGFSVSAATAAGTSFSAVGNYSLSIVPMYILVGLFALYARIAEHVYQVADRVLSRVRGGLGVATISACAGFAAVTGSSVATAATIGRLAIDEMRKRGYPVSLAAGMVAAAGTLGILIPPSIILAIYGVLTGESIAALLAAGIIPGILSALIYSTYIVAKGTPDSGNDATEKDPSQLWRNLPWRGVFRVGVLFIIVMAGVYTGVFTVTKSGALAAFFALIIMIIELRKEGFRSMVSSAKAALEEVAATTSMTFFVFVGSSIFTFFMVSAGIPTAFTRWVATLDIAPTLIVAVLLLALIPMGMALDSLSILIIFVPLTYPVVTAMGFSGIWYAILVVKGIELGQITPPVGINVYVVAGVSGVSPEQTFRGIAPFALMDVITAGTLFFFPQIILWLPNTVHG